MADDYYTAKGLQVWKSPVTTEVEGGRSISIGFHACTATEIVGEEGAAAIAALLSLGEAAQKKGEFQQGQAKALSEALQIAEEEARLWGHRDGSSARVVASRIRKLVDEVNIAFTGVETGLETPAPGNAPFPVEHVSRLERAERNTGHLLALMQNQPTDRHALTYKNYRGETSKRELHLVRLWFGSTTWHPHPQLLLHAFDYEKEAYRDFAVSDFTLDDFVETNVENPEL